MYTLFIIPSPVSSAPLLRISAPSENQTVLGKDITISFVVGNVTIGPEGHLHLWLDNSVQTASTAAIITTHFDYILENVLPGTHTLTLEFVKSDHTSFSPSVKEIVHFTTTLPQNPSPYLSTPPNREIILGTIGIGTIVIGIILLFLTRRS